VADPFHEVALRAADIRERLPQEFDRLVQALKQVEEKSVRELLAAEPAVILAAQAQTRIVEKLREKFENCVAIKRQADNGRR
jgi:hypothetical protein